MIRAPRGDDHPPIETWLDGELGFVRAWRARRHVAACPRCSAVSDRVRAERTERRGELPRYAAPPALVARLSERFGETAAVPPSPDPIDAPRRRWLLAGAAAGSLATIAATSAIRFFSSRRADERLATAALDAHVRATLGGVLVQVASDDRHTVKPWLSARLDYAPPVATEVSTAALDANGAGDEGGAPCRLAGARIDELAGRRVATLVYRYREHVVDVFVWPDDGGEDRPTTIRGFNVRPGRGHDMRWLAVSDVNGAVLDALMTALTR